jgi:hypothetical protein
VRAYLNLRFTVPERRAMFTEGLRRLGYEVVDGLTKSPERGDILVTWNRIHEGDEAARAFTERGNAVLVTENASWGNEFADKNWYTLARNFHNVAGMFPVGGPERWDSLDVELEPWRTEGETVVLASRGIGPAVYRMPARWPSEQRGRIRPHPGRGASKPLREDLAQCGRVLTWGSGAAILALMLGIPVKSHQPQWIGEQDNTDAGRLAMFRRLAWAQAEHEEIRCGEVFERLLSWQGER